MATRHDWPSGIEKGAQQDGEGEGGGGGGNEGSDGLVGVGGIVTVGLNGSPSAKSSSPRGRLVLPVLALTDLGGGTEW